jgi:putative phosphoesterase
MKIAVISDTHGNIKRASLIIEKVWPFDILIHLGDHADDLVRLTQNINCRFYGVLGNEDKVAPAPPHTMTATLRDVVSRDIDIDGDLKSLKNDSKKNTVKVEEADKADKSISFSNELVFTAGETNFYATHGHTFDLNPYYGKEKWNEGINAFVQRAEEEEAGVALFGHTHSPFLEVIGGVLIMNPGDIYPGEEWGHVGIIEVLGGDLKAEILRFDRGGEFKKHLQIKK